jgi:Domain of unknown function (DUF4124)
MYKVLITALMMTMLATSVAMAEVYKWKDKNGVTRYSDVPPNDLPSQPLKPKKAKPANVKTVVPQSDASAAEPVAAASKASDAVNKGKPQTQEEAANKRQAAAEKAKKEAEIKAAEAKQNEENCATAKSNLKTFSTGGRIVKMNENGDREFFDDAGIAKGLDEAKANVDKYCN